MKTMIVGDTHADDSFVANIHKVAREREVETIVQLGDFGFTWDRNMMASIQAWLDRDESHQWFWVDGNHDQHDDLEQLVAAHGWENPIPMHWHERLHYVPRGCVFTLGDTTCMGFGGAYSIDKHHRREGVSWWAQELITASEMYRAYGVEGVDVMFTHDAPKSTHLEALLQGDGYEADALSEHNRTNLSRVVDEVRPHTLYHGHYHHRYSAEYLTPEGWSVSVEGVGANIQNGWVNPTAIYNENYLMREF